MKKRILALMLLTLCLLPLLVACKSEPTEEEIALAGKTFCHDRSLSGGILFSIVLSEDGTFRYSENLATPSVKKGSWTAKDGVLTLYEDKTDKDEARTFSFAVEETRILYIAKDSDDFRKTTVEDGDTFSLLQNLE